MRVFLARQRSFRNSRRDVRQLGDSFDGSTRHVTALKGEVQTLKQLAFTNRSRNVSPFKDGRHNFPRQRDIVTRRRAEDEKEGSMDRQDQKRARDVIGEQVPREDTPRFFAGTECCVPVTSVRARFPEREREERKRCFAECG